MDQVTISRELLRKGIDCIVATNKDVTAIRNALRTALEQPVQEPIEFLLKLARSNDREMIECLLSALEYHEEQTRPIQLTTTAIQAAREHLKGMK